MSCEEDPTLYLWDVSTGNVIAKFAGHKRTVESILLTPDGKQPASVSADRTIAIWELGSQELLQMLAFNDQAVLEGSATAR